MKIFHGLQAVTSRAWVILMCGFLGVVARFAMAGGRLMELLGPVGALECMAFAGDPCERNRHHHYGK